MVIAAPDRSAGTMQTMRTILPILVRLDFDPVPSAIIAFILAGFSFVIATGLLLREKWAVAYVVSIHGIALVRYVAVGLLLSKIGLGESSVPLSSSYTQLEILISVLMVAYLLTPTGQEAIRFHIG
jgi:hypothetical protein